MTLQKFEAIIRFLHFKETHRKKLPGLVNSRESSNNSTALCAKFKIKEHLSIDKQLISNKGIKSSLRQRNLKKPKKWGNKVFLLCGEGGLIHKLELYGGDTSVIPDWKDVCKSGHFMLRLAISIPKQKYRYFFFDNWFKSPMLQVILFEKGTPQSICTLQLCQAKGLTFPEILEKTGGGRLITKTAVVKDVRLYATKWIDNRILHNLSFFQEVSPVET